MTMPLPGAGTPTRPSSGAWDPTHARPSSPIESVLGRLGGRGIGRLAIPAVAALLLAGCSAGTIELSFRPPAGATYSYEIEVESESLTEVEGTEARTSSNSFTLRALHEVVSTGPEGSEVRVSLSSSGGEPRQLLVRLDRAAQLTEVIQVEGLPAEVLGELGLSEIFPAAAGAPPQGPLRPGSSWTVDEPVQVTGSARATLAGTGRLEELDVIDGTDVAVVRNSYRLPVSRENRSDGTEQFLDGAQTTRSRTTYDLSDGSVMASEAESVGRYKLELRPQGDDAAGALMGTLEVRVSSSTRRVG